MFTLSEKRIVAIADVSRNIGQVFFASVLVEPIVSEHIRTSMIVAGIISTIVFFGISVAFSDVIKKN